MKKYIFVFLAFIFAKIAVNLYRYIRCSIFLNKYIKWIEHPDRSILEYKSEIIQLWKNADVSDRFTPRVQAMGLGQIASYKKGVYFSFPSNEEDQFHATIDMFFEARGTYKKRIFDSINPFSWLELIIFFPKVFLSYLGHKENTVLTKILQFIWWVFGILVTLILTTYQSEISTFIKNYFN